jgi:transposase-like protein
VELSEELGIHRRLLYKWRDQLEPVDEGERAPANSRELEVRKEVGRLKRLLADKTLEVDFFKGALQKVEARRRNRDHSQRAVVPSSTRDRHPRHACECGIV